MANISIRGRKAVQAAGYSWPDYQTVWRWHFYAGLFCIPFVIFLATTGSIYLFKPQVEAWLDLPYAGLSSPGRRTSPSIETAAALKAEPGTSLHAYQLPREPGDAAQVLVGRGDGEIRVWVDPRSARILKAVPEDQRFMRTVFHLHGELLLGDKGSLLVELAASWAIIMILTGLYLWWPRQARGLGGLIYPRLHQGGRLFWRDLHAVTAVWVSATTLLLLASGLPWAKSWGSYLKEIRHIVGASSARPDWSIGRSSELAERAALSRAGAVLQKDPPVSEDMAGMQMNNSASSATPASRTAASPDGVRYQALDRLAPSVASRGLAYPVLIIPPGTNGGGWTARSDAQDRPRRTTLSLDAATGAVTGETRFDQRPFVDRLVGVGVAAHEGQLLGWPNQLANLATAAGLITASLSAPILWWRRRSVGLGAPPFLGTPRFSIWLFAVVVLLALALPLLGLSLAAVALIEHLVLRRITPVKVWLGLRDPWPGPGRLTRS